MTRLQTDSRTRSPEPPGGGRRKLATNLRWWILAWLLAATMINYMDRSSLSIAAPHMMQELHITETDIGLLGTVFSLTYAFCQLPAGWLADRFGGRPVYIVALGFWSLSTAIMGIGHQLWHFLASRVLLGIFESPVSPTCAKITADWFPARERGAATGVFDSGSKWGPAVAPPILTALTLAFGWRWMFLLLGLMGVIVAMGFWAFYRSPRDDKRISAEELAYIEEVRESDETPTGKVSWPRLFTKPQTWAMVLGFVAIVWTLNIYVTFLPLLLKDVYHSSSTAIGWLTAIPFAVGGVGGMLGGWFTKFLGQRELTISPLMVKRRAAVIYAGCLAVTSLLVPAAGGHLAAQLAAMSLSLFFCGALSAVGWSIPSDVVSKSRVGSIGSIQNFGGYFAGSLSPILTGVIASATGSYAPSFFVGAGVAIVAGLAYGFLLRGPIREVDVVVPNTTTR